MHLGIEINTHKNSMLQPVAILRITCLCYEFPLESHFYIEKMGFAGVYLLFLFLLQNIHFGYSLEPHRRGGSNLYQCFEQK